MVLPILLISLAGFLLVLSLIWEDWKALEVSLWKLLLLGVLGVSSQVVGPTLWPEILFNGLTVAFILLCLKLFLLVKGQRNMMDEAFGWGDLAMLLAVGCWFPTYSFLWWFVLSMLTAILGHSLLGRGKDAPVPLVAYMGMGWGVVMGFELIV